jgi:hypothetical protein
MPTYDKINLSYFRNIGAISPQMSYIENRNKILPYGDNNYNSSVNNNSIDKLEEEKKEKEKEKDKLNIITKYSNLDPSLFSNEFISDYKCVSCGLIPSFEKANEIFCCGNLICELCLKKLNESLKRCPKCNNEELKTREIKKENKIFYKSFKSLLIKCPYKCDWSGMWVDLDAHLMECKYGYRECKYIISRV